MAAFAWGLLAASSLVLGGLVALWRPMARLPLGLVMGFGAGVLISAVAYELVQEAFQASGGEGWVAAGMLTGSIVFFVGDALIDRLGLPQAAADGDPSGGSGASGASGGAQTTGSGLAIVLGTVLDGIPESVVLGLTVLRAGTVRVALLVAVFLSNLPEAVAATSQLVAGGWSARRVVGLWTFVATVSALAALAGYALFDAASPSTLAFVLAFAGGAILCMLADTMIPEAFENGGKLVGLVTTIGFAVAFAISALE